MLDVLDIEGSFSGHESFTLRYPWLPKAVDAVRNDPFVFLQDDALVTLGVGKNMVRSIRHWALATGVLREGEPAPKSRARPVVVSPLGTLLLGKTGFDPYLEDPATLWLLHWELVRRPDRATTWYWAFNELHDVEFSKEHLLTALRRHIGIKGWKCPSESTLNRDVDCFLRTYVSSHANDTAVIEETLDCPFAELGLVEALDITGNYRFRVGPQRALPSAVVAYAILTFWNQFPENQNTLTFDQIAYSPGSPGKAFKLSEDALTEYLDGLPSLTSKSISYDATAGLRQLYRRSKVDAASILKNYYGDSLNG